MSDRISATFAELGINSFRPMRDLVLVRSNPMPQKTGSIYLPNKLATFFGLLPNLQLITATVLSAGPKATVLPGEDIVFMRLNFAWWKIMEDGTVVGWIQEANVFGWSELEPGDTFADLRIDSAGRR